MTLRTDVQTDAPTGPAGRAGLILGSASPRRLELLAQLGVVPVQVRAADIDETPLKAELPRVYAVRMASLKLAALALTGGQVVLCADTVVAAGRRILGKPADAAEAGRFLRLLSGRRHQVLTAVALAARGEVRQRLVETTVRFRPLTEGEIADYVSCGEWQGKAGGYAIQGRAAGFAPWLQGSFSGVVGLPLAETAGLLRWAGVMR